MVRKGIQNGLTSVCHRDAGGAASRLCRERAQSRHAGILPPLFRHPAGGVRRRRRHGDRAGRGQPIAAVMNFYFRDEVLPYYGGGTAQARQRAGNDFMYWEVMRRAAERGCRLFDFGRSKVGTGAFAFKHNWGFTPRRCTTASGWRRAPRSRTTIRSTRNTGCSSPPGSACRCPSPTCSGRRSCGGWDDGDEPHVRSLIPPQSGPAWRGSRAGAPRYSAGMVYALIAKSVGSARGREPPEGRPKIFNHRCTRMHANGARGRRISATCHDGRSEFRGEPGCRTHTYLRASVCICG